MQFKSGFKRGEFRFGWYEGKLYRLPESIEYKGKKTRNYGLKEIPITVAYVKVNKEKVFGYRCATDKLTIAQVKELTVEVDWKLSSPVKDKHFPYKD